nr:unnamed protein product [Spirometra erinaceieuropaei]
MLLLGLLILYGLSAAFAASSYKSESNRGKVSVPGAQTEEETDDQYFAVTDSGLGPMNSTKSKANDRNLDAPYLNLFKVDTTLTDSDVESVQVQYGYPDGGLRPQNTTGWNINVSDESGDSALWATKYCSFVGRTHTESAQMVSIAPSCKREGKVMHELGHVLGLYHEQSRPDRDDYVEIFKGNIQKEALVNFEKASDPLLDSLGEPYDYDSIMHYHSAAYAKPGKNETIRPKRCCPHPRIGQRVRPSPGDIRRVNKLYKCPSCGQTLMEYSGTFKSPQSESLRPSVNSNTNTTASSSGALVCQWRIIGKRGEQIRLNFTHMGMSPSTNRSNDDPQMATTSFNNSQHCVEEYVEVRDEYYSGSPLIGMRND